jgi:hypothetical protein
MRRKSALPVSSRIPPPAPGPASPASVHAAGILDAWRNGDRGRLTAALAAAANPAAPTPPDWHEQERTELLAAAASDLRAMLAFTRTKGADVPLRLLEHLASD